MLREFWSSYPNGSVKQQMLLRGQLIKQYVVLRANAGHSSDHCHVVRVAKQRNWLIFETESICVPFKPLTECRIQKCTRCPKWVKSNPSKCWTKCSFRLRCAPKWRWFAPHKCSSWCRWQPSFQAFDRNGTFYTNPQCESPHDHAGPCKKRQNEWIPHWTGGQPLSYLDTGSISLDWLSTLLNELNDSPLINGSFGVLKFLHQYLRLKQKQGERFDPWSLGMTESK